MRDEKITLTILGVHLKVDAYPNVKFRIEDIYESQSFLINEINFPMWTSETQNQHGLNRLVRNFWRIIFAHYRVLHQYLKTCNHQLVYIPYPAIILLNILYFLPKKIKPKHIVTDAFISIYDTVVNDRKLLVKQNPFAKLLKLFEKNAYKLSNIITVDTEQNAEYFCETFKISSEKIVVIPLSTDEYHFQKTAYQSPNNNTCNVLFIGTLIPLHGIETILKAADLLSNFTNIKFKIIGDGQHARFVQQHAEKNNNTIWERAWKSHQELSSSIQNADICLGIFGDTAKTQRVCPLKIYAYAACGRTIITGDTQWAQHATANLAYNPFVRVLVNNPAELAKAILELANNPKKREVYANNSYRFYGSYLSNHISNTQLTHILVNLASN